MFKAFSLLVGVSMLGLVGMANAAEPTTLTDAQMDGVTAGQLEDLLPVFSPAAWLAIQANPSAPTLGEVISTEIAVFRYYVEGVAGLPITVPLPSPSGSRTTPTPTPTPPTTTTTPTFYTLGGQPPAR